MDTSRMARCVACVALVCSTAGGFVQVRASDPAAPSRVVFVDDDSRPGGNGRSWPSAFRDLQDALDFVAGSAGRAREIRVAQGTYRPSKRTDPDDPRSATFELIDGVALRGGYAGHGVPRPHARDPGRFPSVLSGDLAGNDGPNFTNNEENVYHVVSSGGVGSSTELGGFVITGGTRAAVKTTGTPTLRDLTIRGNTAWQATVEVRLPVLMPEQAIVIENCRFVENGAASLSLRVFRAEIRHSRFEGNAGDAVVSSATELVVTGCTFAENGQRGLYIRSNAFVELTGCEFRGNADLAVDGRTTNLPPVNLQSTIRDCLIEDHPMGGVLWNGNVPLRVIGTTFRRNGDARVQSKSGGLFYWGPDLDVRDCVFFENQSGNLHGGAVRVMGVGFPPRLMSFTDCVFSANSAPDGSGGAVFLQHAQLFASNCDFVANRAADGGAIRISSPIGPSQITHCRLVGNRAETTGAGVIGASFEPLSVSNCLLVGNVAGVHGGAGWGTGEPWVFTNCTIAQNAALSGAGGGLVLGPNGSSVLDNCILWGNVASGAGGETAQIFGGTPSVAYSCVEGLNVFAGNGNIGDDPAFVGGPAGVWTSAAVYDTSTGRTTLFDATAQWPDGALAGNLLNPDSSQFLQSLVVSNTATRITVWGDFTQLGAVGAAYQVNDYRLSGPSPCVDAGDNTAVPPGIVTDLGGRPRLVDDPARPDTGNGTPPIVDMGAYERQVPAVAAVLDILPVVCPNRIIGGNANRLRVAILGSEGFDAATVDPGSVVLERDDGQGPALTPLMSVPGLSPRVRDVATPVGSTPCLCHPARPDGRADLTMFFDARPLFGFVAGRSGLEGGGGLLKLTGATLNGASFEAFDCVVLQPLP